MVSLSEELQALRLSRNRLDQRREELQLELAGWKLKEAFGVGRSGLGLGAGWPGGGDESTAVMGEVFHRWRLAFLEGRQEALRSEAEENRGKAESYESLVQRLSEELERQGEAVNRHASLLRERDEELDVALDRAARAHDELISMEPPSLSQAVGGLEILLRVSATGAAAAATATATTAPADDVDDDLGSKSETAPPKIWCLVRYAIPSSQKRRGTAAGLDDAGDPEGGHEQDASEGEREEEEDQEEEGEVQGAASSPRGNRLSAGHSPAGENGVEDVQESAAAGGTGGDSVQKNDASSADGGEVVAAAAESAQSSSPQKDDEEGDSEDDEEEEEGTGTSPDEGDTDTVEVVEWRPQEDVDEWFAAQLARALEAAEEQQASAAGGGGGESAGGAMDAMAADVPAPSAPVLPVLETPMTLQQAFEAELSRVRGELEGRLEEARAELRRNTEAYKQYRARVREGEREKGLFGGCPPLVFVLGDGGAGRGLTVRDGMVVPSVRRQGSTMVF